MKKLCCLLSLAVVTILASTATAQETYSVPATSGQVTDLTAIVSSDNVRTCLRANDIAIAAGRSAVVATCTQAQACVGVAAAGGAACTAAQARTANARIFPLTQAGREEYVSFQIILPVFVDRKSPGALAGPYKRQMCQKFWPTANQTQKNVLCAGSGNPDLCELCP